TSAPNRWPDGDWACTPECTRHASAIRTAVRQMLNRRVIVDTTQSTLHDAHARGSSALADHAFVEDEGGYLHVVHARRHRGQPRRAGEPPGRLRGRARDARGLAANVIDVQRIPERRELARVRGGLIPPQPFGSGDGVAVARR